MIRSAGLWQTWQMAQRNWRLQPSLGRQNCVPPHSRQAAGMAITLAISSLTGVDMARTEWIATVSAPADLIAEAEGRNRELSGHLFKHVSTVLLP